jgi:hypothetical protein
MGDVRDALLAGMAAALVDPAVLADIKPLDHAERARLEAEHIEWVERQYAEAVRQIGPGVVASFGLDPDRYELAYEVDRGLPQ